MKHDSCKYPLGEFDSTSFLSAIILACIESILCLECLPEALGPLPEALCSHAVPPWHCPFLRISISSACASSAYLHLILIPAAHFSGLEPRFAALCASRKLFCRFCIPISVDDLGLAFRHCFLTRYVLLVHCLRIGYVGACILE